MNQVKCLHCGKPLHSEGSLSGQSAVCPDCGEVFQIKGDSETTLQRDTARPLEAPDGSDSGPRGGLGVLVYSLLGVVLFLIALIGVVIGARHVRRMTAQRPGTGGEKTLQQWIRQLEHGRDEEARREAAAALVRLGPEAVIEALDATTDVPPDGNSFFMATQVVPALASTGRDVVDALARGLESEKEDVRVAAANVLREIGPEAAGAVDALTIALGDGNRWVRWFSAEALGNIGPDAASAVDAVVPLVEHTDGHTRLRAVKALGHIGPAAKAAVPPLTRVEEADRERSIRQAAKTALYQINLDQIADDATRQATDEVRELIERLQDEDEFESASAANELGRIGPAAVDAIPALAKALGHTSKWVREAAAETLGSLGSQARSVVPALRHAAKDEESEVRTAARRALEKIEDKPRP